MMNKQLFLKEQKGTATLEFAVILPMLFMITFMTLLYLFWMGDAMLQSYAGYKFNQIASKNLPFPSNSPLFTEISRIPTMNLFQNVEFQHQNLPMDTENQWSVTRCYFENPLLPTEWLRLAFLVDWGNPNRFTHMYSFIFGIHEPYAIQINHESP